MNDPLLLENFKSVYFIGIGGTSMSSLAMIMKNRGCQVKGYDRCKSERTDMLEAAGIKVFYSTEESHFSDVDLVVYTVAFTEDSPEMKIARSLNVPVITRAKLLEAIGCNFKNSVGIAGTHGKSTTSGMVSQIFLEDPALSPTILIGAKLPSINSAFKIGNDENFIFEACEYKDSFLSFYPKIAAVLNISLDHTDYFPTISMLIKSFTGFMNNAGTFGTALINADDENAVKASRDVFPRVMTFSLKDENADFYAASIREDGGFCSFDFYAEDHFVCHIDLSVIGRFNVANALAAAAIALMSGISGNIIKAGLEKFHGVARRFDYLGEFNGAKVYTDYAHHPEELKAVISAAKHAAGQRRVVTVFQPHTYSRLRDLFDDFTSSFEDSDLRIFTDVFSAREKNIYNISSEMLSDAVGGVYIPDKDDCIDYLAKNTCSDDLILFIGAGDINETAEKAVRINS